MSTSASRLNVLDWLRALALIGVFLFHAVHPFDAFDWHVKNAQQSELLSLLLAFVFPWGLGFFFMIAGAASFMALQRRSPGQYVKQRLRRLLIPYALGYVALSPLQAYVEENHQGDLHSSYMEFIPTFFARAWRDLLAFEDGFQPLLLGWSYHLWFLLFLLWFSLLALPLFVWLRGPFGQRFLDRVEAATTHTGSILLFGIPAALIHVGLRAASPAEHQWGEFSFYLSFFVLGYVIFSRGGLIGALKRDTAISAGIGVVGFTILILSGALEWADEWPGSYSWKYVWMFGVFSMQAWAWVVAAIGVGLRIVSFQKPLPAPVAATSMAFFLVHQPTILIIAFFVVETSWAWGLKLTVVLLTSFAVSSGLAATQLLRAQHRLSVTARHA